MPTKTKQNYKPGLKDLCQTPGYAVAPILPYLLQYPKRLIHVGNIVIWECAVGEQYLYKELSSIGFSVIGTDIKTGQDFLTFDMSGFYDVIVTNPPFSLKYKFLERCYELEKPFALLMPVDVFGAKTAQKLFSKYGGGVILLDKRINFKMPNIGWNGSGSQFPVAWFTKGLGVEDSTRNDYGIKFYSYDWLTSDKRREFEV